MKLFKYLLVIMGIVAFASCDNNNDDEKWDWEYYPVCVRVDIVDNQGNKLFDDTYAGIIDKNNLESEVTCIFEGEKYPFYSNPWEKPNYGLKYSDSYPGFYGLYYILENKNIEFGSFYGGEDHSGEFTICWPDGTSDTVAFKSKMGIGLTGISVNGNSWEKTDRVKFVK